MSKKASGHIRYCRNAGGTAIGTVSGAPADRRCPFEFLWPVSNSF